MDIVVKYSVRNLSRNLIRIRHSSIATYFKKHNVNVGHLHMNIITYSLIRAILWVVSSMKHIYDYYIGLIEKCLRIYLSV